MGENNKIDNSVNEVQEVKKKKRRRIYDITPENDIRYRGPLSYRWLKTLGWIALVFSQYVIMVKLGHSLLKIDAPVAFGEDMNNSIIELALPLLLFGNFALLLNGHDQFKKHFFINGGAAAGIILLFLIIYYRYVLGIASVFFENRQIAAAELNDLLGMLPMISTTYHGFFAFNIFIDMFLCTLGWFFIVYTPKKLFRGRLIYIFRALILIPVLYEIGAVILKMMAANNQITLPVVVFPFLPTKPPFSFLLFIFIGLYIKMREKKFLKHGKTREEYQAFLKTNVNSLHVSLIAIVFLIILIVVDYICYFFIGALEIQYFGPMLGGSTEEIKAAAESVLKSCGFGEMGNMLIWPILLLFSYTRTHKNVFIDGGIAVLAVICIILIYIDGTYGIIRNALVMFKDSGILDMVEMLPGMIE